MKTTTPDRLAAKIVGSAAKIEALALPEIIKHGDLVGRSVERHAPKRTYGEGRMRQSQPGVVSADPYLTGEYRGRTQHPPNRRFLQAGINEVRQRFERSIAAIVRQVID